MMFLRYLMLVSFIYQATEAYLNNFSSYEESKTNLSQQVWHSYEFDSGVGNREELYIVKVAYTKNFSQADGIFKWRTLQKQGETVIFGLGKNSLLVTKYGDKNETILHKEENIGKNKAFNVFEKWDPKTQKIQCFVVLAVSTEVNKDVLKWFVLEDSQLKFLYDWPFHRVLDYMDVVKFNQELKLLIVSHHESNFENYVLDIYNLNVSPEVDLWLFEEIQLVDLPSSLTVFSDNDNIFLTLAYPQAEIIHIWRYLKTLCQETLDQKHFVLNQEIASQGLKSLTFFRVGFLWHIAVASRNSSIYQMGENLQFSAINHFYFGNQMQCISIPIDTYRQDVILLYGSNSGLSALIWNGNEKFKIINNFTDLICKNDTECMHNMNNASLMNTTVFQFHGHQNIIMTTQTGVTYLVKLSVKLRPLPDKIFLKLNEIIQLKDKLQNMYSNQAIEIENWKAIKDNSTHNSEGSNFKGSPVDDVDHEEEDEKTFIEINRYENLEAASHTKNWSDTLVALDILRTRINILKNNIKHLNPDTKLSFLENNYETQESDVLPGNISNGIVFHGKVVINNLNLSSLNGHDIQDLLKNSYRKDSGKKIGGTKAFKNLSVKNLEFDSINNIGGCNIVFSDDPWHAVNGNVITSDILWESKLNILNDLTLLNAERQRDTPTNNYETLSNVSKYTFDELYFEELEIKNETNVQSTINSRTMILPVHMVTLDTHYLERVNQARVELVNVKGNLSVGLLNGKNVTQILDQISLKEKTELNNNNFTKIQGALTVQSIHLNKINSFPLRFNRDDASWQSGNDETNSQRASKQNSRNFPNNDRKRNIYVFQDLDVNGRVHTESVNNLNWKVLNATLRKGEEAILTGVKTFTKSLSSTSVDVLGTINEENFPRVVMTNFSDQVVEFPQSFSKVKFNNLTLRGTWDDVYLDKLNRSIAHSQSELNDGKSNLTVTKGFTLLAENIVVTNFVNHASLTNGETQERKDMSITAGHGLNLIKASKVIVDGSINANYNVNGVNLKDLESLRVSLSQPQVIEHDLSSSELVLNGHVTVISLNDNDVSSVVDSDGDINIINDFLEGELHGVKKLLVKGHINTSNGINDFDLSRLSDKGIYLGKPESVEGTIAFQDVVHFKDLNVTSSVDGYSLKELEEDLALKHSHIFINGVKSFNTLKVTKDMKAKFLNGHLVQDVISLQGDQVLKGSVTINGDVIIRGNMTTNGDLNGITVPNVLKKYSTQHNSYIFTSDLNLSSDQIHINNLMVGGEIQNVAFDDLVRNAVYKDACCNVTGMKQFLGEVKFKNNLMIENTLNGIIINEIHDIALVNQPCKIDGSLMVEEAVLNVLNVGNFNSLRINNFDINDWFEDSIPLNRWEIVSGKMKFLEAEVANNVEVDLINGHMSSAIIPLKGKQFIPVLALFQRVHSTSDISVGGYVNNMNLIEELEKSVLLTTNQTINNKMIFNADVIVNGNLIVNTIDGKSVNHLLRSDSEQAVGKSLNFHGAVTVRGNIDHLRIMNNINLKNWYGRSVLLNRAQEITGVWSTKGSIIAKNIGGEVSLNSVRLTDVSRDINRNKMMTVQRKDEAEMEYYSQCHEIEHMSQELYKLPFKFHLFEVAQIIDTQLIIEAVIPLQISGSSFLIVTFQKECFSSMYQWQKENSTYIYLRHINLGPVSKWLVTYRNNATYLITSHGYSTVQCDENRHPGNIWVFEDKSDKYIHLLTCNAFVDLMHENDKSDTFYTLEEGGAVYQWVIKNDKNVEDIYLVDIGQDNYKFLDFQVLGGLALSNGREIKEIKLVNNEVLLEAFTIPYGNVVALPFNGKVLVSMVLRDKILIYENFREEKLFSVVQTYKAGSVLWFNYGVNKQAFLIVSSHHKLIEIFEYKSVSGFVKRMSLQLFSTRLQSLSLPFVGKHQLVKVIAVIQRNKIIFLEADMLGDFYNDDQSTC